MPSFTSWHLKLSVLGRPSWCLPSSLPVIILAQFCLFLCSVLINLMTDAVACQNLIRRYLLLWPGKRARCPWRKGLTSIYGKAHSGTIGVWWLSSKCESECVFCSLPNFEEGLCVTLWGRWVTGILFLCGVVLLCKNHFRGRVMCLFSLECESPLYYMHLFLSLHFLKPLRWTLVSFILPTFAALVSLCL